MPFPLVAEPLVAEPLVASAAAEGRPAATTEAADLIIVLSAAAGAAFAAGGGWRAGAFILGQAIPARQNETIVHESCSKTLYHGRPERNGRVRLVS